MQTDTIIPHEKLQGIIFNKIEQGKISKQAASEHSLLTRVCWRYGVYNVTEIDHNITPLQLRFLSSVCIVGKGHKGVDLKPVNQLKSRLNIDQY